MRLKPKSVKYLATSFSLSALLMGTNAWSAELRITEQLPTSETKEKRDQRMAWWREARFGMFIHWGIYAQAGGYWKGKNIPGFAEWMMSEGKIPVADYATLVDEFNPVKFDADQWVTIAKQAGMKYIVITAKHHDGFAMFHTATDSFNIFDATPFKRDPLAELAIAARKQGIKLGFYYSQAQDWHHPGGVECRGAWDMAQAGNTDEYLKNIAVPQVKELLTRYGPISVLWWDTPCEMNSERAGQLASLLKLQPQIITNDRLGGGFRGDTGTPEGTIPPFPLTNQDWETCMTINGTWGYRSDALDSVRSSQSLLLDLINTASKGGNYLLNIGPDSEGKIPDVEAARLQEMGKWLKTNGEAIYATSASPFRKKPLWGRYTQKSGKLFLHVLNRPADGKIVVPIRNHVSKVSLLALPKIKLKHSDSSQGILIQLPDVLPDPIDTVVVIRFKGQIDPLPEDNTVRSSSDGTIGLNAMNVQLSFGGSSGADSKAHTTSFGGDEDSPYLDWKGQQGAEDTLQWNMLPDKTGDYDVILNYATWPYQAGSTFSLAVGTQKLVGTLKLTQSGYFGEEFKIGSVHLDALTPIPVILKGTPIQRGGVASHLFSLSFKPSLHSD